MERLLYRQRPSLISFLAKWKEPFASWKNKSGLSAKDVELKIKEIRGTMHMNSPTAEQALQTLEKYCKNLTH